MRKTTIVLTLAVIFGAGGVCWYQQRLGDVGDAQIVDSSTATLATSANSSTSAPLNHPGMKLYRNQEFGFEFWYPENWVIREERDLNSEIRFSVAVYPAIEDRNQSYFTPFNVLITTQRDMNDFLAAVKGNEKTSSVVVDGRKVVMHKFVDTTSHANVIIPGPDFVTYIGNNNNNNVPEFNQILSTFKFLK